MAKIKKTIEASQDRTLSEDSVSDNINTSAVEGKSVINAKSVMMKGIAAMDKDQWVKFFQAVQAQVGHEADLVPGGAAAKNQSSVHANGVKEEIDAIFGGDETLAEETKDKMATLFESAVNVKVAVREAELQEEYEAKLVEEVQAINEGLVEKLDEYVSHIAREIISENKIGVVKSLRADLMESFFQSLAELFVEHNFNVPTEQVEVVDMLATKVDALEEDNNKQMLRIIELEKTLSEKTKAEIIGQMSENLTAVEADKFKTLVEGFDLQEDVDAYVKKLETVKQHHFNKTTAIKPKLISDEVEYTEEAAEKEIKEENADEKTKALDNNMKRYMDTLRNTKAI